MIGEQFFPEILDGFNTFPVVFLFNDVLVKIEKERGVKRMLVYRIEPVGKIGSDLKEFIGHLVEAYRRNHGKLWDVYLHPGAIYHTFHLIGPHHFANA